LCPAYCFAQYHVEERDLAMTADLAEADVRDAELLS
jgi:hypothetical protein